jgi:hypothetical protein
MYAMIEANGSENRYLSEVTFSKELFFAANIPSGYREKGMLQKC